MKVCVSYLLSDRLFWYCLLFESSRTWTVEWTAGCDDFGDEKPQPKIGNLGTQTHSDHPSQYSGGAGSTQVSSTKPIDHGYTPVSAKLMEEFLEKGWLNPKHYQTKKDFLKHFATWLIKEDLLFTTGESHGIKPLFKYLLPAAIWYYSLKCTGKYLY